MDSLQSLTVGEYLDRLASGDAVPGGGAAAALSGAQGAALLRMVIAVSNKEPTLATNPNLPRDLAAIQTSLLSLATEDGDAFSKVMDSYKLPGKTDAEKTAKKTQLQAALKGAADVPMKMLKELERLFPILEVVATNSKPTIASDAALAVHLIHSSMKGAYYNVRINLKYVDDEAWSRKTKESLDLIFKGRKAQRKALLKRLTTHF